MTSPTGRASCSALKPQRRVQVRRAAALVLLLLALFVHTPVYGADGIHTDAISSGESTLTVNSTQVRAYQYVIAAGVVPVVAAIVPLHAFLPHNGRIIWHTVAFITALASGIAAIIGATYAHRIKPYTGTLWQAIPTAVLMLSLAFLIQIQVVGGWNILRLRARARGRVLIATLRDRHWRDNVSAEEYARIIVASGLKSKILRFGSEPDQDAAVVAVLPTMRRWMAASHSGGEHEGAVGGDDVVSGPADPSGRLHPRHEPSGLALLGSVRYASLWLEDLLNAVRRQPRNAHAIVHNVCVILWWLGMISGALSKTGFNARTDPGNMSKGVKNLRTAGIWLQAFLLVIGIYLFPYTRAMGRYGTRVWPRAAVLIVQTASSLGIGVPMLVLVREVKLNHNLIAYALALMVAATACAMWCLVSVTAHQEAVRMLLARDATRNRESTAYIAAIVTRPRHGYQSNVPVLRWGELDRSGRAALEISVEKEVELSVDEVIDERLQENEVGLEWNKLESAARPRVF
jgi:hypothetical protein